jgi:hypothetical protein
MTERLKALLAEYGKVAVWIYVALFLLVLAGFSAAIGLGMRVQSAAGSAGTLGAAWVATKLTQPARIGATVLLTPLVARLLRKRRSGPTSPGQGESGKSIG